MMLKYKKKGQVVMVEKDNGEIQILDEQLKKSFADKKKNEEKKDE